MYVKLSLSKSMSACKTSLYINIKIKISIRVNNLIMCLTTLKYVDKPRVKSNIVNI